MLRKKTPLPLYHQLQILIEERIHSGDWLPGMLVPSERELCEQFRVSRITVRRALAELEGSGRLVRRQGLGTFVGAPRIEQQLARLTGFTQDMQAAGKKPASRVLQFRRTIAPAYVYAALGMDFNTLLILLERLRLTDGEPLALESAYLPVQRFPGLLEQNFEEQSLYHWLAVHYGVRAARADQQFESTACPSSAARHLGIRRGSPVMHIFRTTYPLDGPAFEFVESYYRGDRYIFRVELNGNENPT